MFLVLDARHFVSHPILVFLGFLPVIFYSCLVFGVSPSNFYSCLVFGVSPSNVLFLINRARLCPLFPYFHLPLFLVSIGAIIYFRFNG